MNIPYTKEDANYLFHVLGQAVWYLQHLENVMTTFNAMKIVQGKRDKKIKVTGKMAQEVLDKQRRQTLGPLIEIALREKTIPKNLVGRFKNVLEERNWLIHKCVIQEFLSLRNEHSKRKLFNRIEAFVDEVISLRNEIINLTNSWYSKSGYDFNYANSLADKMLLDAEKLTS